MNTPTARRTVYFRIALLLLVSLAILTAAALLFEWFKALQSSEDRGWDVQLLRLAGIIFANMVLTGILVIVLILFLWVRTSRSLPDLQGWHLEKPASEFKQADAEPGYRLVDYLKQEGRIFEELNKLVSGSWASQCPGTYSRFQVDSVCNPETIIDRNWNRSRVLEAVKPVGGVLLLHGLSDSPYSLRALGHRFHSEGYTVVWLRLPGHGTNPRALADVAWRDWTSAVEIGVQGLRDLLPENAPLILAGYSNGAALAVNYALAAIDDDELPTVDALVLFSPMIGINPMARLTRLYHTVALVSRNEKAQWSSINAEIDPFKYSSWPMNANEQAWSVTKAVERKIGVLAKSGRMSQLPPILAMQSVVDSTVVVHKLITVLFDHLESGDNELVLFDVNRMDWLSNVLNLSFEKSVVPRLQRTNRPYRLTVLKNTDSGSRRVLLSSMWRGKSTEQETGLSWPLDVVSLSHIAVPIPPDDPIYGAVANNKSGLSLGSLHIRAEPGALLISNSVFTRSRNNPFYELMEERVVDWLRRNTNVSDIEFQETANETRDKP